MTVQVYRLVDQDINLWLITGQTLTITPREHWRMFLDLDSAIFFCSCFCLITFLFPIPPEAMVPWWMKLAGFTIFLVMIPVIYFILVLSVASVSSRFPRFFMLEPLLLMVTGVVLEIFDNTVQPLIFGPEWLAWVSAHSFGEQVIGTIILLETLHVIFCVFVLPRKTTLRISPPGKWSGLPDPEIEPPRQESARGWQTVRDQDAQAQPGSMVEADQTDARHTPDTLAESTVVELDGRVLSMHTILAIEAEEHYVRIWTEDRELYIRHSFSGLMAQMTAANGFSPRRGIWFSFRNIAEIRREDSGKFVIIPCKGPATVVPKAKASEVRKLIKHCPLDALRADGR